MKPESCLCLAFLPFLWTAGNTKACLTTNFVKMRFMNMISISRCTNKSFIISLTFSTSSRIKFTSVSLALFDTTKFSYSYCYKYSDLSLSLQLRWQKCHYLLFPEHVPLWLLWNTFWAIPMESLRALVNFTLTLLI